MIITARCKTCGATDRPVFPGSLHCMECEAGEPTTVMHTPAAVHECRLVQPVIPGLPSKETWAPAGTIQRCNVCGSIWLAEPPIRVSRGQQSCANRWVQISWRRARRIMKTAGRS